LFHIAADGCLLSLSGQGHGRTHISPLSHRLLNRLPEFLDLLSCAGRDPRTTASSAGAAPTTATTGAPTAFPLREPAPLGPYSLLKLLNQATYGIFVAAHGGLENLVTRLPHLIDIDAAVAHLARRLCQR